MKRILFSSFLSLIFLFLASCAFHSGTMNGSVAIQNGNFKYIRHVSGSASSTSVFGIGGLLTSAIVDEARMDLYDNHQLKNDQALANISVDTKRSFIFFVWITTVTVSADIIEFTEAK